MDLLNKLTIKNLKLNRKRTIVTIIGIMLSVALITAVATMYSSAIKTLINYEIDIKGDFHVAYYDVSSNEIKTIKNTREVKEVYLTKNIGYAKINSKNESKPYAFIKEFTNDSLNALSIKLVEGRLPQNENEILIPTHLKTNGRVTLNIGDTISLDIGKRISLDKSKELNQSNPYQENNESIIDTKTKNYKIVGIIERPATNIEEYTAPGYTFVTYMNENNINGNVDVFAKYTKKGSKEYTKLTANILGVDEKAFDKAYDPKGFANDSEANEVINELEKAKCNYNVNTYLIALENNPIKENGASQSLGMVVVIVVIIIIVTSVFCIKNSFDISITEKIKQYGMLRSIGATKKQIKKNVFYEATILGIIGIPLGLLLGFLASYILIIISNMFLANSFEEELVLVLSYSWVAFAISILLGIVTIYFSAFRSAKKASKVSPIDSIRNSANIKINSKKVKCPKIIKKIFKIGGEISYKNLKRNKKKYRTTTISIVISVTVFIALSFFISSAFSVVKEELELADYNIVLTSYRETNIIKDKLYATVNLDNIEDYAIYQYEPILIKNPKYNKEYIEFGKFVDEFTKEDSNFTIITIGDYQYKKYLNSLKLDYNEFQNKGILIDSETVYSTDESGKKLRKDLRQYSYKPGDIIEVSAKKENDWTKVEIGYVTTKDRPFGFGYGTRALIVSDSMFENISANCSIVNISYKSNNASKLQDDIEQLLGDSEYSLTNKEENAKMMGNLYTLIAIFLYGFIIVISLIGITNIFNTITTNMELRKQEFAMLKSIGMTKNEFRNMIRLESVFMGAKALVIGIPIGIALSYLIYKALEMDTDGFAFKIPYIAILICIIVVYLLITVLMKYSMNKINKQNTIETIRNENI